MTDERKRETKLWVGIGASAGGLEALRRVVRALPVDTGAAFFVVQHISANHKSLLSALLARETVMKVVTMQDGMTPQSNTVHVAPPNYDVSVIVGKIVLHPADTGDLRAKPSVDRFFRSIAEFAGVNSVGIVLSGTGSDGGYGVQAIRAAGGVTVAQTEVTAKYFGMPQSAIETGCVDLVLSPEDIGHHFNKFARRPRDFSDLVYLDETRDGYLQLLQLLYSQCQVDFRQYKQSSIRRRVERRIAALGLDGIDSYLAHARETTSELEALRKDLLISVTSFFRDPQEFEALSTLIGEELSDAGSRGLRIWVPGCATGEEAYSIAILIGEMLGGPVELAAAQVQIFATDIDGDALEIARRGRYAEAAFDHVPSRYVERYFTAGAGGYAVNSALADKVIFSQHNICDDPPFSNIDLISCRNLLIYLGESLQQRVLNRLHYALINDGILFLGKSEITSPAPDRFRKIKGSAKIFRRLVVNASPPVATEVTASTRPSLTGGRRRRLVKEDAAADAGSLMFDALARSLGGPSMVVTESQSILKVYGDLDDFITLSEGQVAAISLALLRDAYRQETTQLIALALRSDEVRSGVQRKMPADDTRLYRIKVYPISMDAASERAVLVCFELDEDDQTPQAPGAKNAQGSTVEQLQRELDATSQTLQQTVEELETTNEELQALNEELQASNEELQATNEELETSNEELQSTNEELITVNEELQINSQELSMINQELDSILANIAAPVLVISRSLHIVRCSRSARTLFRIDPGIGRPHLSQCRRPEGYPSIADLAADVVKLGLAKEVAFEAPSGRGQILAAPYFDSKGEMSGATAIVTGLAPAESRREIMTLLNGIGMMCWQKDSTNTITWLNQSAASFMGVPAEDAVGESIDNFVPMLGSGSARLDHRALDTMKPKLNRIEKISVPDVGTAWLDVSRIPVEREDGSRSIYVLAKDISEEYQGHIGRGERQALLNTMVDNAPVGLELVDRKRQILFRNPMAVDLGSACTEIGAEEDAVRHALEAGATSSALSTGVDQHGEQRKILTISEPIRTDRGAIEGAVVAYLDAVSLPAVADVASCSQNSTASWRLVLPDGGFVCCEGAARILGLDPCADATETDLIAAFHRDDQATVRHGIKTASSDLLPFTLRVRTNSASEDQTTLILSGKAERSDGNVVITGSVLSSEDDDELNATEPVLLALPDR